MPLKALSEVLWRERELLEQLVFRLEVEQLLLANGRTARLSLATKEVEDVLARIRQAELGRSVEVDEAARVLGLDDGASLLDLAQAAPAPWDAILVEHRKDLLRLAAEIGELASSNRDLLASSRRATQETLMDLELAGRTYAPTGASSPASAGAQLLDETS